jgi:hypothetical protein
MANAIAVEQGHDDCSSMTNAVTPFPRFIAPLNIDHPDRRAL